MDRPLTSRRSAARGVRQGVRGYRLGARGRFITPSAMKLEDRLFLFSTTQLVVFGGLFVVAYALFYSSVIPAFRDLLYTKSEQVIKLSSLELDVPLAAEDMPMIDKAVAAIAADPDLVFIKVRDASGGILQRTDRTPVIEVHE